MSESWQAASTQEAVALIIEGGVEFGACSRERHKRALSDWSLCFIATRVSVVNDLKTADKSIQACKLSTARDSEICEHGWPVSWGLLLERACDCAAEEQAVHAMPCPGPAADAARIPAVRGVG